MIDLEVAYNGSIQSTEISTPFFLNYVIHTMTIPFPTLSSKNTSVSYFITTIQDSIRFDQEKIRKSNESAGAYANSVEFRMPFPLVRLYYFQ